MTNCGATSEFGRRAALPFSSDLAADVEAEEAEPVGRHTDNWEEPVDTWAEPGSVPATTTTILLSEGPTFGPLSVVVVVTAAEAVVPVGCPMPQ